MTEDDLINLIIKRNEEGAYERGESVPAAALMRSTLNLEERLLLDYVRKNPERMSEITEYLKRHRKEF